jgi:ferredoxin
MPTVTVEGEKSFEVEEGKKLVLAIEDAGIDIMHRCGGNARCTTCRVQVLAGDAPAMEALEQERLAQETNLEPNTRLSCQIRVAGREPLLPNWDSSRDAPAGLNQDGIDVDHGQIRLTAHGRSRLLLLRLGTFLATGRALAHLAATARAAVILCLSAFLFAGTEWHGPPRCIVGLEFDRYTLRGTFRQVDYFGERSRNQGLQVYSISGRPGQSKQQQAN